MDGMDGWMDGWMGLDACGPVPRMGHWRRQQPGTGNPTAGGVLAGYNIYIYVFRQLLSYVLFDKSQHLDHHSQHHRRLSVR
jgi:hypothetical protein